MNKENDIVTVFGNPAKSEYPIDQARLIKKISDMGAFERWWVEYTNDEGHKYDALIRKQNAE